MLHSYRFWLVQTMFIALLWCLLAGNSNATGGDGYLGMSLPKDFLPFSSKSPWNTPIGKNPEIDPDSSLMIKTLMQKKDTLTGNILKWTIPLFVIDSQKSPKVDVRTLSENLDPAVDPGETGIARGLPVPEGVWPDPEFDSHMLLVDPKAKKSWDYSRARKIGNGWVASRIAVWDLSGPGYREPFKGKYWWTYGARGSGFPLIAGLIRPEEIEAGEIRHALVFAGPLNRKSSHGGTTELCAPPASRTDGTEFGTQFISEGARLQLDPSVNLDTLNLSPATKIIARAMQKYGMYNGDNADNFVIYFQNLGPDGGKWKKYNYFEDLKNIPIEKFRVLKCKTARK